MRPVDDEKERESEKEYERENEKSKRSKRMLVIPLTNASRDTIEEHEDEELVTRPILIRRVIFPLLLHSLSFHLREREKANE